MEFLVDSIVIEDKKLVIKGVCTKGSIKIGDECHKVYKKIFERTEGNRFEFMQTDDIRVLSLKLTKIIAYRHSIDHLPEGMSGEIYLVGIGGNVINNKDTLCFSDR